MIRTILAILAGIVVAFGAIVLTDAAVQALSNGAVMPEGADPAAMRAYMDALPDAAFLAFVAGCFIAAAAGAITATRLGRRGAWPGWIVAGLLLLATAANFAMVPHPLWVVVAGLLAASLGGWLGTRASGARRPA